MVAAAGDDASIAERVEFFKYRSVEELYDFRNDPDALHNLIGEPEYQDIAEEMRGRLLTWMRNTGDTAANALENIDDPQARKDYMAAQDARAARMFEELQKNK
jgi:N-sulfoglucosamine sulfohydrolase